MQYCRGYYMRACCFAHKGVKACLSVDRKVAPVHCTSCAHVFWSRTDAGTCRPRRFTTGSYSLAMNKNAETKEINTETKSKIDGGSRRAINEEDFFGFEGGHGVIDVAGGTEPVANSLIKYNFLIKSRPKVTEETVYVTTFGNLRFDVDNHPRNSKDTAFDERDAPMEANEMADGKQTMFSPNAIDDQYYQSAEAEIRRQNETLERDFTGHPSGAQPNYLEEQHFGSASTLPENEWPGFELPHENVKTTMTDSNRTKHASNVIEEQYFPPDRVEIEHSDVEKTCENATPNFSNTEENPIEAQYFGNETSNLEKVKTSTKATITGGQHSKRVSSFIEEQYFNSDESKIGLPNVGKSGKRAALGFLDAQENATEEHYIWNETPSSEKIKSCDHESKGNGSMDFKFIDEQYFDNGTKKNSENQIGADAASAFASVRPSRIDERETRNKFADHKLKSHGTDEKVDANAMEDEVVHTGLRKPKTKVWITPDIENPKTAFDYAMKVRQEKRAGRSTESTASNENVSTEGHSLPIQKIDSFGFRIYSHQVIDLEKEPEFVVLKMLKDCALYNENDILALSKPYGLPVHHGAGHRHFLTKYLPDLAKCFCTGYEHQELYTVHRLDKETTGVILLAKTQEMAKRLNIMFAQGEIKKTYWALTKGTPSPLEGIIDIPIGEATIGGKLRMVLKAPYSEEMKLIMKKSSIKSQKAVTHFKVLASNGNAALVELSPSTGVKHQLRVHLASALACPVLGDHKYSHLTRLAPQKLPADVLQRLGMRQSKVRTLSMHLHARGVVIPQLVDGRNIIIGARLPLHFKKNMQRLKIKPMENKM